MAIWAGSLVLGIGLFAAANLFLFFIFWELMVIPLFLLIGVWGGPGRVFAAIKFLLFTLAGSVLMLVGIMSMFEATLTLPGIAGLVLTVGMAVDANVIIFERIREELRLGKSVRAAIAKGFEKDSAHLALSDIRDSIDELSWYREHLLDVAAAGADSGND